jgi:hypothetical protein
MRNIKEQSLEIYSKSKISAILATALLGSVLFIFVYLIGSLYE